MEDFYVCVAIERFNENTQLGDPFTLLLEIRIRLHNGNCVNNGVVVDVFSDSLYNAITQKIYRNLSAISWQPEHETSLLDYVPLRWRVMGQFLVQ